MALALFAALAALIALAVLSQRLSRQLALDATEYPALRVLGMPRPALLAVSLARLALVSGTGGALAVAIAVAGSPLMPTGPKVATVRAGVLRGSTGTSPAPAALVTWIVPAGALSVAPVIDTGPPTSPNVPGTVPSVLPLTEILAGLAFRKPKATGRAALKVLPSGWVAWNFAPSDIFR